MNTKTLFSTGKDNWETPYALFQTYHKKYDFTLDAAADRTNHKTERWFGPGGLVEDALSIPWSEEERIWLNPPYSKGAQRKFVERAVECARNGGFVVALLPARTDTRLFHDLIWDRENSKPREWVRRVDFLKGRVKFINPEGPLLRGTKMNGSNNSAPFPSMIVVFG